MFDITAFYYIHKGIDNISQSNAAETQESQAVFVEIVENK